MEKVGDNKDGVIWIEYAVSTAGSIWDSITDKIDKDSM